MSYYVALDAGHWEDTYERTGGKGVPSMEEFEFNKAVVTYMKELAEHNGFKVLLTQPFGAGAREMSLRERTDKANAEDVDFFFSCHADASRYESANGHWGFYWYSSSEAKRFAHIWEDIAKERLPNRSRGVRESKPNHWTNFHVLRETRMSAFLGEHAFMTNAEDLKLLKSEDFRKECAEVGVRALCKFFDVPFKELPPKNAQKPSEDVFTEELWKYEGIKKLHANGLLNDLEGWAKKINEPMPTWAVTLILSRIHEDLKKRG